ncbi:CrcB family protein [Campylobacter sp. 9BO]|uniref:fluoride efflux transporter FluC n=1 Tax=Campylobacter sp. 9BO TaxID=3424759 RepID=UPI003D33AFE0
MLELVLVGFGGFIGAICRSLLSTALSKFSTLFPFSTLLVNILGSFAIGAFLALNLSQNAKSFLVIGILGGFTTFSAFSYQSVALFSTSPFLAILNILTNVILSLLACYVGIVVFR